MTTEYIVNATITLSSGVRVLDQFVTSRRTREQAEAIAAYLQRKDADSEIVYLVEEVTLS